jgi:predicted alpha/beta hydrolase
VFHSVSFFYGVIKMKYKRTRFTVEVPGNKTLTLWRVKLNSSVNARPIIMLHGMFSSRKFWLSDNDIGMAAYLCQQGYECWIFDRRGIGDNVKGYKDANLLTHCIKEDLPAIQKCVHKQNPQSSLWIAHSFGGVLISSSIAQGYLNQSSISGLVFFGTQLTVKKYNLNRPLSINIFAITALFGHMPGIFLRLGSQDETKETARDCVRLVSASKRGTPFDYWKGFECIEVPVLAVSSVGDSVDSYKGCRHFYDRFYVDNTVKNKYVLLGKQFGHRQNYSHTGMVLSKDAQEEVWPSVSRWMKDIKG